MNTLISHQDALTFNGDLLIITRPQGEEQGALEAIIDTQLNGALSNKAARALFKGRASQSLLIDTAGHLPCASVMVVGLGEGSCEGRALRDVFADAARVALKERAARVAVAHPFNATQLREVALGFELGLYRFDDLKTPSTDTPRAEVEELTLMSSADVVSVEEAEAAMKRTATLASAVNLGRTLVNEPPNICTPQRLADVAREMTSQPNVGVKVLGRDEVEALGMGGLIAVSQGATREPQFIHVHYRPEAPQGALALIGKGLTFDSGGLSLKPPKSQEDMHIDMGGAAAVLGAMWALVRLQPQVELHAIVGACENMPDGNSFRPSDVLTMYNKKTVEVLNTDAEGRLVLADALHYAAELKPDAMVNLATLTGACMVGLGSNYCGLFSDSDAWAESLLQAGEGAGEKLWRLPLDEGLADTLKSKRADIKNLGGPYGGAITAALFLKHFKGDCTWAHMDIAGPTTSSKDSGSVCSGGTGFGVLTLIELAERFKA